jgi:hypothetical protein
VRKLFKSSAHSFPAAAYREDNPAARHRRSSRHDIPPTCWWCAAPPLGELDVNMPVDVCSERPSKALLPAVHRHLQHPRPAVDPSVPSSPNNVLEIHAPSPRIERYMRSTYSRKKHIEPAEREILVLVYGYYDFPKPFVHGFPTTSRGSQLPVPRLAPYRVEVEVGTDGLASAPPPPPLRRRRAPTILLASKYIAREVRCFISPPRALCYSHYDAGGGCISSVLGGKMGTGGYRVRVGC